jgi:RNA polymerase sigma-70 factor (family 1)
MTGYKVLADAELAVLLQAGDAIAYEEIYDRYHILLYLYAYKKLKDKEAAKDLIQEVFLTLWNKRNSYSIHTAIAGYLYRAVRNKALDIFAHRQIERKYIDSLQSYIDTSDVRTDDLLREKEIKAIIDTEIALLPKGMREVFLLSRREYLTHREIAERLDMTEEAVKKQIKRALKTLRMRLGIVIYVMMCLRTWYDRPLQTSAKKYYAKKSQISAVQNVPLRHS